MKLARRFRRLAKGAVIAAAVAVVETTGLSVSTQADSKLTPINTNVYTPKNDGSGWLNGKNYAALSPRVIQLEHQANPKDNGKLLMTFEQVITNNQAKTGSPSFPIYESDDSGKSWKKVSSVLPTNHQGNSPRWGFMNCPQLYELPEKIGDMPKGTVVLAGNATPNDFNDPKAATDLEMMRSDDAGQNWTFESSIATAGPSKLLGDPVWEPYLMVYNHQLVCYYSDERDSSGLKPKAQALVHQTTTDGKTWSPIKFDVDPNKISDSRPGMATLAQLSNGKWVLTYEQEGGKNSGAKISDDPTNFNSADAGTTIAPGGAPYVTKLNNGDIAFNNNGNSTSDNKGGYVFVFKDQESLLKGTWHPTKQYSTQTGIGYNRQILPLANGMLLIANGHETNWNPSRIDVETIDVGDTEQTGGNVTVHYVDQNGKSIAPDDVLKGGQIGTSYDVSAKTAKQIDGYTLTGITTGKDDVTGNFGADPIDITVSYRTIQSSGTPTGPIIPNSNTPTNPTNPTTDTPTKPTSTNQAAKPTKVKPFMAYAKRVVYKYDKATFTHSARLSKVAKNTTMKVVATAQSTNGAKRYQLSDGTYVTAKDSFVAPLYLTKKVKQLRVIKTEGVYTYKERTLARKNRVKHVKRGTTLRVKRLITHRLTTRYQLTNGNYVTGNVQFVK